MTARILGIHLDDDPAAVRADYPGHNWGGAFISNKGKALPRNITGKTLSGRVLAAAKPHIEAGGGCIVRVKTNMQAVMNGEMDDALEHLGASCQDLPILLIVHHEPEDDMPAGVFVPGFNKARFLIKRGGPGVDVAYAGMAWQWRRDSPTTKDPRAWAEDLQADWYLIDLYFGNSFAQSFHLGTHPGRVRWHAAMIAPYRERHHKVGIAEWGRMASPDRAGGFAEDFRWLAEDPVGRTYRVVCPWGTPGTKNETGLLLDDAARRAIRAGFKLLSEPTAPPGFHLAELDLTHVVVCQTCGCHVAGTLTYLHTH